MDCSKREKTAVEKAAETAAEKAAEWPTVMEENNPSALVRLRDEQRGDRAHRVQRQAGRDWCPSSSAAASESSWIKKF